MHAHARSNKADHSMSTPRDRHEQLEPALTISDEDCTKHAE
eukprot:COSAG02_NODE_1532_length_12086_cov_6.489447_14_plen_41_part_00